MKMTNRQWLGTLTAALLLPIVAAQTLPSPRYQTPSANDNSALAATTSFVRGAIQAFAGAGDFIANGTGAVKLSIKAKLLQRVDITDYGAVSDPSCAADSTAAIQAAINALPNGGKIQAPPGSFCLTSVNGSADGIEFEGTRGTKFLLTSATADAMSFAPPAGKTWLEDFAMRRITFWTKPGLTKTGGAVLRLRMVRNPQIDETNFGNQKVLDADGGTYRLYDGLAVVGFSNVAVKSSNFVGATHDCMVVAGLGTGAANDPNYGAEFVINGGTQFIACGRRAAWIAGGAGGVRFLDANATLSGTGIYISTELNPGTLNREIFASSQFSVDSNYGDGYYAEANSYGFLFCDNCWSASNNANGFNLLPQSFGQTVARFTAPHIYNNGANGIASQAANTVIDGGSFVANGRLTSGSAIAINSGSATIDGNPLLLNNSGYGLSLAAPTQVGTYNAIGNGLGPAFASVPFTPVNTGRLKAQTLMQANAPIYGWSVDTTGSATGLAQNQVLTLAAGSGKVTLSIDVTGAVAEFLIGGGNVALIGQTASVFVAGSNAPAAGKISLWYDSSNSSYKVTSNYGSAVTLGFAGIRLRESN